MDTFSQQAVLSPGMPFSLEAYQIPSLDVVQKELKDLFIWADI